MTVLFKVARYVAIIHCAYLSNWMYSSYNKSKSILPIYPTRMFLQPTIMKLSPQNKTEYFKFSWMLFILVWKFYKNLIIMILQYVLNNFYKNLEKIWRKISSCGSQLANFPRKKKPSSWIFQEKLFLSDN